MPLAQEASTKYREVFALEFVWALLGGIVLYVLITAFVKSPGASLQSKFVSLGTLKGRMKEEIIHVVGPPASISATGGEGQLLQWMATGYHIALLFDSKGICQGVTHEASV